MKDRLTAIKDRTVDSWGEIREQLTDAKDTALYRWDGIQNRFLGPHSYGDHNEYEDLYDDMFLYTPPDNGTAPDEYLKIIEDELEHRKDRLEDLSDSTIWRTGQACRIQGGKTIYLTARITGVGMGAWGVMTGQLPGKVLGAMTMGGALIGFNFTSEIQKYRNDEFVEEELQLYQQALEEIADEKQLLEETDDSTTGNILPDSYSGTLYAPPLGAKSVEFEIDSDGLYQRKI